MELWQRDASDLARLIRFGQVSSREAVTSHLARMDAVNGKLNAVVRRMDNEALATADACDAARARGKALGPLHGVPVTTKKQRSSLGAEAAPFYRAAASAKSEEMPSRALEAARRSSCRYAD